MRLNLTREAYIRRGADPLRDPQSDAVVYVYNDERGRPCAQVFSGKKAKPDWHYVFPNEEKRDAQIESHFKAARDRIAAAEARAEERRKPHTLKVGDIMVCSWGWEQTQVDFLQIVKTTKSTVTVRRIRSEETEDAGRDCGRCVAVKDSFIDGGVETTYRANAENRLRITSYSNAYLWDGKSMHWSRYA